MPPSCHNLVAPPRVEIYFTSNKKGTMDMRMRGRHSIENGRENVIRKKAN